ncbi:MAG: hypothetical protein O7G30_16725, partial [Proteobacteria bacterium]|nr:hypothetical protein [Pseudomonadota bacterium]
FEAVVGDPEPGEAPEIAAARPLAEEVLGAAAALSPLPIPRDDVVLAVRITVRSTSHFPDDVLAMREDVQATAPNVIVTDVLPDPHPDVAAMIFGTFDAPVWVENGYVVRDDDGAPVPIGTAPIDFILALPAAAAESGGAPIVMYQHGNPGNAPDEVPGAARDFLAPAGFAVGGMTDVPNRTFAAVLEQTLAIFTYVLFFGEPPDWYLQTYAEQMAFLRALQSLDELDVLPLGDPDGVPDLDPSKILYEGISYGSVHAQAFLAYSPDILGAALVAGASRLAELIEYQDRTTPDGGPRLFVETLPAFLSDARAPDLWLGLHLFAISYDRQDPHNHARFLFRDPVEVDGTTKKASLLVVEGLNDSFTKANTTRSLAWLLGPIPQLEPVAVPVLGLPSQAGPIQANIDADTTAAFVQFVPSGVGLPPTQGCDFQPEGHFCAQTAPPARTQRLRFYTSALTGPPVIEFEPEL